MIDEVIDAVIDAVTHGLWRLDRSTRGSSREIERKRNREKERGTGESVGRVRHVDTSVSFLNFWCA